MGPLESISIIGDSILRGVIFDEVSGKYKFIKESAANLFSASNKVVIHNHSKFGFTTKKALEKLPQVLAKNASSNIILLELGGNDCDFNWNAVCERPDDHHIPNILFTEFKKNLAQIISQILSSGKRPVVMTLPPIDADKYYNFIAAGCKERAASLLKFLGDKNYIYRHQELYATALETIALKYNLFVIPVREKLLTVPKYSDYLCFDGIHLNELGQKLIEQVFEKTYKEYLASA